MLNVIWKVDEMVSHIWTRGKYMVLDKVTCPFISTCDTFKSKVEHAHKLIGTPSECDGKMLKLLMVEKGVGNKDLLSVANNRCPVYFKKADDDETDTGTDH